jgi:hypothetical protein
MKKLLLAALLAMGAALIADAKALAEWPVQSGIGMNDCHRVGRWKGYWKNLSNGKLYDYSPYFAAMYPQLPGAAEFQWHGNAGQTQPYGYGAPLARGR